MINSLCESNLFVREKIQFLKESHEPGDLMVSEVPKFNTLKLATLLAIRW